MAIPQFTAEVSLYNKGEPYRNAVVGTGHVSGQTVIPQALGCVCRCVNIPLLGKRCAKCCVWPPGCKITSSC